MSSQSILCPQSAFVVETNAKSGLEPNARSGLEPNESRTIVRNATLSYNPIEEAWTAFAVSSGGDLVVSGCIVENNENLQVCRFFIPCDGSSDIASSRPFLTN
jgi:hypothetical protein